MTMDTTQKKTRRGEVATVAALLEVHDSGRTHSDLSRDLREALERGGEIARDEGKATTKVTVTITAATTANGRTEVKVGGKVTAPRPSHPTTVLHAMEGGTLSERDPKQLAMPWRKPGGNNTPPAEGGDDDNGQNNNGN